MISEEKKKIDKTSLDRYPLFKKCERLDGDVLAEKNCFIQELSNHIEEYIIQYSIVLNEPINEVLKITIEIDEKGKVSVKKMVIKDSVKLLIPNIETIIVNSLSSLPKIEPAYKRISTLNKDIKGEPVMVNTQFIIPINVVSVEK